MLALAAALGSSCAGPPARPAPAELPAVEYVRSWEGAGIPALDRRVRQLEDLRRGVAPEGDGAAPLVQSWGVDGSLVVVSVLPDVVGVRADPSVLRDLSWYVTGNVRVLPEAPHAGLAALSRTGVLWLATSEGARPDVIAELRRRLPHERIVVPALVVRDAPVESWGGYGLTSQVVVRAAAPADGAVPESLVLSRIEAAARKQGLRVERRPSVAMPHTLVLSVESADPDRWLESAARLQAEFEGSVQIAPNVAMGLVSQSRTASAVRISAAGPGAAGVRALPEPVPPNVPTDSHFADQWHLRNTGQSGGTPGADVGAIGAWSQIDQLGAAVARITVAVLDFASFEVRHEDLEQNVLVNEAEDGGVAGVDDDGNGYVDDRFGWDFAQDAPVAEFPVEPGGSTPQAHGTCAAGLIGARVNGKGVVGVAPRCWLLNVRLADDALQLELALRYARQRGARVIALGFGKADPSLTAPIPSNVVLAMDEVSRPDAEGRPGAVIVASLSNALRNNFLDARPVLPSSWSEELAAQVERLLRKPLVIAGSPVERTPVPSGRICSLAQHRDTIAVGRSTNLDRWGRCGFGNGMSLLAPSDGAREGCDQAETHAPLGTLAITTTDLSAGGYASGTTFPCDCDPWVREIGEQNYTGCFGGTSAAVPIVAGAAALVLSVDPTLGPVEVRTVLERTATRIEPGSIDYRLPAPPGHFQDVQGGYSPFRGYGRLNAAAAVGWAIAHRPGWSLNVRAAPQDAARPAASVTPVR